MKKTFIATSCLAGLLMLSACSSQNAQSAQSDPSQTQNGQQQAGNGQRRMMTPEQMQQYITEANAAPDKTTLTKDEFTTELQTLMQAQRAKFQPQNGGQPSGSGGGFGRGFSGQPRNGSGGMMNRLATATTFEKYTDPSGNEALLALDADGNVVMKWPRMFGNRGGGMMNGPSSDAATSTDSTTSTDVQQ